MVWFLLKWLLTDQLELGKSKNIQSIFNIFNVFFNIVHITKSYKLNTTTTTNNNDYKKSKKVPYQGSKNSKSLKSTLSRI